ncbi:MAG TPA: hypothetical protein VJA65_08040 [bacterium]|nr:hypothetical protein [bacterium]
MDNRMNAAERFIDERQYEAMRAVARARLQREALRGAADNGRAGGLSRALHALRKALNHSLRSDSGQALQRETPRRVPVAVEIRRS